MAAAAAGPDGVAAPAPSSKPAVDGAPMQERRKSSKSKTPAVRYPFWFGGSASSMAACVTHPLDLVKV
ncbi:hypothetical protein HIM_05077 [Hirsutella minnesotensis 3608]|uniref:Uncharacterized protein n=1 Tax=Hirsutella minnesotensis 3608 TaxID=1043627 RepID=A0A0F8A5N0_9HYPO|nr:hypothetical protein HIM_05077 [Hirsutella minnesotensis 3608]